MNEASKMVSVENAKWLDKETQERTGLELNPLWMLEVLVRGAVLDTKTQVSALKTLAEYTHSKSPAIQHALIQNSEQMLLELGKEEYGEVELEDTYKTKHGEGREYERTRKDYLKRKALMVGVDEEDVVDGREE